MLLSVVIPIYNVLPYLRRCVASVTSQDHKALDIILVDDGSDDGSGELCDRLATSDARIRVIHKPNGGLSSARNAGIEMAQGECITFVDSDDFVAPDFASTLLDVMQRTGADIASCQWVEASQDNPPEPQQANCKPAAATTYAPREALERMFYQNTLTGSACSRIFKKSLFDGIRFPEGMLYEDLAIAYDLVNQANSVAHTQRKLYFYLHHEKSITGHFTPQRLQVLDILDNLEARIAHERPELLKAVQSRKLSANFNMLRLMPLDDEKYNDIINRCWRNIKALRAQELLNPKTRAKNKVGAMFSFLGLKALLRLINGN